MAPKKKPTPSVPQNVSSDKKISIAGNVVDSAVVIGDHNTVTQTFIQKVFNIFRTESESIEQRNRRILLGHVENFWVKGVLEQSLHGAALLDLGIKEDPDAVTKYPWAIKKESTDEALPAGTSMLEIFDNIGMGRSLLILGAPGSGKTTMLLELARQLIQRARQDVTEPIPMVFNLASWTEKLTLADWLAQELNKIYSVPRRTAPDWVKGNKLLLLLDGLDEVRHENRAKCVEAINEFRKEHGMTSLVVCSRSQDYADLNTKLSFEGAIEVQPLTQKQVSEFFSRCGKEAAGIKQVLKKDSALREMAETPLFLSIIVMTYRGKQDVDILTSTNVNMQRKYLFDTYIERMFEHQRSKNPSSKKQVILCWLSWLAKKMIKHNRTPYSLEDMQPDWYDNSKQTLQHLFMFGIGAWLIGWLVSSLIVSPRIGLGIGVVIGLSGISYLVDDGYGIYTVDSLSWDWGKAKVGLLFFLVATLIGELFFWINNELNLLLSFVLGILPSTIIISGLNAKRIDRTKYVGQRLALTTQNSLLAFLIFGLIVGLFSGLIFGLSIGLKDGLFLGRIFGLVSGFFGLKYFGGFSVVQHYVLRLVLSHNNLLPLKLIPFLDHCVDLIFLRRVGGGYIFVHRLLMEHFAEMYKENGDVIASPDRGEAIPS